MITTIKGHGHNPVDDRAPEQGLHGTNRGILDDETGEYANGYDTIKPTSVRRLAFKAPIPAAGFQRVHTQQDPRVLAHRSSQRRGCRGRRA